MSPLDTPKIPRNVRGVALILAAIAMIPVVAFAANASHAEPAPEPTGDGDTAWHEPRHEPARLALRLAPDRLELAPGEEGRATYTVLNDGPRAANVRVALHADGGGDLDLLSASEMWYRLAPGESVEGTILVRAPADEPVGVHLVRVEAAADEREDAPSHIQMAFLHVLVPPQPILFQPIDMPEPPMPPVREAPACPVWEPPMLRVDARLPIPLPHFAPAPCWTACEPCARAFAAPPPCEPHDAGVASDELVLRLLLRGRVVDGQLVIDLDDETRARLAVIAQG